MCYASPPKVQYPKQLSASLNLDIVEIWSVQPDHADSFHSLN